MVVESANGERVRRGRRRHELTAAIVACGRDDDNAGVDEGRDTRVDGVGGVSGGLVAANGEADDGQPKLLGVSRSQVSARAIASLVMPAALPTCTSTTRLSGASPR